VLDRRRYGPGSQWLYAKFYVAAQAADDLIVRALLPAIAELRESAGLDCWFFVRYGDPQHHMRVRFRSAADRASEVREWVVRRGEEWLRRGLVQRYAFDTYDPEYERYNGAKSMEAIERFFCADSDLCAALLVATPDAADARVAAAARSFYPFVLGDDLERCATRTLRPLERRKLEPADRVALKQLATELRKAAPSSALADAVAAPCSEAMLAAVFHLHCNRLALSADAETRAMLLLRSLLVSRNAA
jgi:thiopeptide-type bacteriocin biosynthesis protein